MVINRGICCHDCCLFSQHHEGDGPSKPRCASHENREPHTNSQTSQRTASAFAQNREQADRHLCGFQTECKWGFDSFISLFELHYISSKPKSEIMTCASSCGHSFLGIQLLQQGTNKSHHRWLGVKEQSFVDAVVDRQTGPTTDPSKLQVLAHTTAMFAESNEDTTLQSKQQVSPIRAHASSTRNVKKRTTTQQRDDLRNRSWPISDP